jgi:hypothetical protein
VGSRAAAKTGGLYTASSPLPFCTDGDLQTRKKTQAVDFNPFLSRPFLGFFFSSFPFWICFSTDLFFSSSFTFSVLGGQRYVQGAAGG